MLGHVALENETFLCYLNYNMAYRLMVSWGSVGCASWKRCPCARVYGLNMENMQIFVFESIHAPAARIQMPRTSTRYLCLACMN
jgi:hypothetical protein